MQFVVNRSGHPEHMVLRAVPGTLVHRLFLTPHQVFQIGIALQHFLETLFRERIKLLDAYQRGVVKIVRLAFFQQVVEHLAGAHDHPFDILVVHVGAVVQNGLEPAFGKVFQGRFGTLVAQQTFRRHHHQGLTQRSYRLAPQKMEYLRRRGGHAHLHVVLGAQLQETFQTGGGMLRALAFVAVRQQQGEAAQTPPLGFARGHELIDHHLGTVGEVAELRFPDDQRLRRRGGVTVLKAEHRLLGEQ